MLVIANDWGVSCGGGVLVLTCNKNHVLNRRQLNVLVRQFQAIKASMTALGFSAAILSKARAGPSGRLRPCSQF